MSGMPTTVSRVGVDSVPELLQRIQARSVVMITSEQARDLFGEQWRTAVPTWCASHGLPCLCNEGLRLYALVSPDFRVLSKGGDAAMSQHGLAESQRGDSRYMTGAQVAAAFVAMRQSVLGIVWDDAAVRTAVREQRRDGEDEYR